MKVLDIYSKKDLDILTCRGKSVSKIMDDFFKKLPSCYRSNYDKNLEGIQLWRVDETPDKESGIYSPKTNILIFKNFSALPHELQHVSSYDRKTGNVAFVKDSKYPLFETALLEGYAEFLSSLSLGEDVTDSFFECFVVSMLSSIEGIFEPFYIPNHDKFISLFPNKKDIYSLMYSLDYYRDSIIGLEEVNEEEMIMLKQAIRDTIDTLIDIELSFKKSTVARKEYGDKFMDLISDMNLKDTIVDIYDDYQDYAFHQIKKRVLRRIG